MNPYARLRGVLLRRRRGSFKPRPRSIPPPVSDRYELVDTRPAAPGENINGSPIVGYNVYHVVPGDPPVRGDCPIESACPGGGFRYRVSFVTAAGAMALETKP